MVGQYFDESMGPTLKRAEMAEQDVRFAQAEIPVAEEEAATIMRAAQLQADGVLTSAQQRVSIAQGNLIERKEEVIEGLEKSVPGLANLCRIYLKELIQDGYTGRLPIGRPTCDRNPGDHRSYVLEGEHLFASVYTDKRALFGGLRTKLEEINPDDMQLEKYSYKDILPLTVKLEGMVADLKGNAFVRRVLSYQ